MKTALDILKPRHGTKEDGETVLKHAELGNFRDSITNPILGSEQLKQLGITPEMQREEIIHKLRMTTRETEALAYQHRYAIKQVIDFCATPVTQTSEFYEKEAKNPLKETMDNIVSKIDKHITNPFLDAIGRKIYTGSFFRKSKK